MTGYAFATALAAPVEDGMMLAEAARPARQSLPFIELSTTACEAVDAWTVVMRPCLMPNFSLMTLTRGARPNRHVSLVVFLVDADNNGWCLSILGWCRNDHLLCATLDVLHAALCGGEGASGLAHVLNTCIFPWNLRRVARAREGNLHTIDLETLVGQLDTAACLAEAAMDRVMLKLVLHVLWRHRGVDVLEDEILTVHCDACDLATNAAKAIDAELDWRIWVCAVNRSWGPLLLWTEVSKGSHRPSARHRLRGCKGHGGGGLHSVPAPCGIESCAAQQGEDRKNFPVAITAGNCHRLTKKQINTQHGFWFGESALARRLIHSEA